MAQAKLRIRTQGLCDVFRPRRSYDQCGWQPWRNHVEITTLHPHPLGLALWRLMPICVRPQLARSKLADSPLACLWQEHQCGHVIPASMYEDSTFPSRESIAEQAARCESDADVRGKQGGEEGVASRVVEALRSPCRGGRANVRVQVACPQRAARAAQVAGRRFKPLGEDAWPRIPGLYQALRVDLVDDSHHAVAGACCRKP